MQSLDINNSEQALSNRLAPNHNQAVGLAVVGSAFYTAVELYVVKADGFEPVLESPGRSRPCGGWCRRARHCPG